MRRARDLLARIVGLEAHTFTSDDIAELANIFTERDQFLRLADDMSKAEDEQKARADRLDAQVTNLLAQQQLLVEKYATWKSININTNPLDFDARMLKAFEALELAIQELMP